MFQCLLLGVAAEHNLPFTMVPVMIDVVKSLAKDPQVVSKISVDRTSASYKMTYGMAHHITSSVITTMRNQPFSLNIDESTSANHQRVLSILVSYYDSLLKGIAVRHLVSISMIKVDSLSLFNAICDIFTKYELPWGNLMSILMDSCNVMRGSKSGLETRIRQSHAPHLLDIDGDSCHHIHNAAKKMCEPFQNWVERMLQDLHNDFKWSPDLREALQEICIMLNIKFTMPERMVPHRWLSMYDVTVSTLRMMDPLSIFYFSFLSQDKKTQHRFIMDSIFANHQVSAESRERIRSIQCQLSAKKMTDDGKNRKMRVLQRMFDSRRKTRILMHFYLASLPLLKKYVCLFESKQPQIHLLHDQQKQLFINFLACFMKQEMLVGKSVRQLKELDIKDRDNWLKPADVFVGAGTDKIISKLGQKNQAVTECMQLIMSAYSICGHYLQTKLPLNNALLKAATALDPTQRGSTLSMQRIKKLPSMVSNVLDESEVELFAAECHSFQVDATLPSDIDATSSPVRVDHWWASVMASKKYPCITKLCMALLTCFHGPMVEGSFSAMGDILDAKSTRLNMETYSALQTVKYDLRAKGKSATEMYARSDIVFGPVNSMLCQDVRRSYGRYKKVLMEKRQAQQERKQLLAVKDQKRVESKKKEKESIQNREKKARKAHRLKLLQKLARKVRKGKGK